MKYSPPPTITINHHHQQKKNPPITINHQQPPQVGMAKWPAQPVLVRPACGLPKLGRFGLA